MTGTPSLEIKNPGHLEVKDLDSCNIVDHWLR